ncbi:hypothetical protein C922_04716 [Plasmodium inui San Antonio 1]|uniref:General stress protein FMN-binding split barrel domain-containing protein n=1 Tax=Plasmodium inui San Antonio 1 TaxID=1237626 RepID=W6ZVS0_9APIC|nr:hypothetical protein C922_04716 [Plasmodium inui San Antonio 1]EUD64872.1 hypothetical protein C922_04716 [Plasmodium inui San Antonio 1]
MNNLRRGVTSRCRGMLSGAIQVNRQLDMRRNNHLGGSSHLGRNLCTLSHQQNIRCLARIQRRGFFFKSEKNDIIKNEIEEILKTDKDPLMGTGWTKDVKERDDYSRGSEKEEPLRESNQKKYKNKRGNFKRLFIFIAFQSIPIVGLMYLFKYIESVKLAELNFTFESSDDIIKEALKLIRGNSKCFCMYSEGDEIKTFFVDPLGPEESEVNYEPGAVDTKDAAYAVDGVDDSISAEARKAELASQRSNHERVNGRREGGTAPNGERPIQDRSSRDPPVAPPHHSPSNKTDDLTKIVLSLNKPLMQRVMNVKSPTEFPLNYVYFCISKNTEIYNFLKHRNEMVSLLYSDDAKNVYVTLTGSASIIENEVIREVIWTNRWSYLISDNPQDNYVLIKFTPSTVSLKTIGFKNQHWKSNIVRRSMTDDKMAWVKG